MRNPISFPSSFRPMIMFSCNIVLLDQYVLNLTYQPKRVHDQAIWTLLCCLAMLLQDNSKNRDLV